MPCILCEGKNVNIVYKSANNPNQNRNYLCTDINNSYFGTIVKCQNCGLIYTDPRPSPSILQKKYTNFADPDYLKEQKARLLTFKKDLLYCQKFVQGGKLLDVGCLCGLSLISADKNKWQRYGLDLNQWGIDYARKKFGLRLFQGDLFQASHPDNFFNLVTMWDALEHLENPRESMEEVNRILERSGFVAITTPNIASLSSKIFKNKWWFLSHSHIFYFSPQTIKALLEKTEFKVIQIRNYTRAFSLEYWLSKVKPLPFNNLADRMLKELKLNKKIIRFNTYDSMIVLAKKV